MIPIVKSPQYERDLAEIWHYIARDNPLAADRVVTAIENTIELLSEFRYRGGLPSSGSGAAPDALARVSDLLQGGAG